MALNPEIQIKPSRTGTNVMTSPVRAQFVNVVEPRVRKIGKDTKTEYSLLMLIDPTDPLIILLKDAAKEAALKKWPNKMPTMSNNPFKDGNTKEYQGAAGMIMVNVSCDPKDKPFVVDMDGKTIITDPKRIYSGCWVRVALNAGAWQNDEFKTHGVSFFLQGVQLVQQDEALGGSGVPSFSPVVSAMSPFEDKSAKPVDAEVDDMFA
jgi:Protein of unknown function (DUF2815)